MPCRAGPPWNLALICGITGGWAFSFGLGTQVVSHFLASQGFSNGDIGIHHAGYYLGLALASLAVPVLMRWWGNGCSWAGLCLAGLTLVTFPLAGGWWGYLILRFLNGVGGAMCLIPLETWISRGSACQERTRRFACYGVALTLGGALGIWIGLHFFASRPMPAFLLGGAIPLVSGLVLAIRLGWSLALSSLPDLAPENPAFPHPNSFSFKLNFLSFGTAWYQGYLEGGMLAFLSLYLLARGLTADEAGLLMGLTMVGVIAFQVPVSWLADRYGQIPVLLSCYAVVAAGLVAVPWCGGPALAAWLFLFGACAGAMYPLGLAMLGERVAEPALPRAYAWYLALECLGSQLGAAVMGLARDWWGENAMFYAGLAPLALVLGSWIVLRTRVRYSILSFSSQSRKAA